jgi:hypothetical protein
MNKITIYNGNTATIKCSVYYPDGTDAVLSGYSALLTLKQNKDDLTALFTSVGTISDNEITFNVSDADNILTEGVYYYEVIIESGVNKLTVAQDRYVIKESLYDWTSNLLFFASDNTNILNKVVGGGLPNQVTGATDFLTVTGTGLNARYRTPNNATYKTADSDYVFWKTDASESTCDGNRLIGYDFPRILVKYLNVSPYTILWIGILNTGFTITNTMRDSFNLSIWWDDILSTHGMTKDNRGVGQSVWTAEVV